MIIVPFVADHIHYIDPQPEQKNFLKNMTKEYAESLQGVYAYSAITNDGVVACAGIQEIWDGRGLAWSILGNTSGQNMARIHRAVLRALNICPYKRVEMYVNSTFSDGCRWADMLGFEREGLMRSFFPSGLDAYLYARMKNG